jgi:hypothetical protein
MKSITASLGFIALVVIAHPGGASAQVAFTNGVTGMSSETAYTSGTWMDLGTSQTAGYITRMPMSLSYGGVNVNVSFTGNSGLASGSVPSVLKSDWGNQNFFAASSGSVIMNFSTAQRMFSFGWGSPGPSNQISFFNGSQLLATTTNFGTGINKMFTFSELGYNRVVMSEPSPAFEFGNVYFDSANPTPLPIGSVGGLIAFLAMMGARRRGVSWKSALRAVNPLGRMPATAQA